MKVKKNFLLNFIGTFLIILGLIRVFQLLFFGVPVHVFWLCNHVIIFIGIAILFRNSFLLMGEFCLLFIGEFIWVVAVMLYGFFDVVIPGNSAYLIYGGGFINFISVLVHFLTLPLGLWAIILIGKKQKFAWTVGLIHSAILLPVILYFGSNYNLNCLIKPCISFIPNIPLYSILVIPIYFLIFVIPLNYLTNWILKKRELK